MSKRVRPPRNEPLARTFANWLILEPQALRHAADLTMKTRTQEEKRRNEAQLTWRRMFGTLATQSKTSTSKNSMKQRLTQVSPLQLGIVLGALYGILSLLVVPFLLLAAI